MEEGEKEALEVRLATLEEEELPLGLPTPARGLLEWVLTLRPLPPVLGVEVPPAGTPPAAAPPAGEPLGLPVRTVELLDGVAG